MTLVISYLLPGDDIFKATGSMVMATDIYQKRTVPVEGYRLMVRRRKPSMCCKNLGF